MGNFFLWNFGKSLWNGEVFFWIFKDYFEIKCFFVYSIIFIFIGNLWWGTEVVFNIKVLNEEITVRS